VSIHWTDYWTGLLDWTTGLTQNGVNTFSSLFQCRREASHVYSAYFLAKFAPLACSGNFTGVGRGQRSRAYLISFNNELQLSLVPRPLSERGLGMRLTSTIVTDDVKLLFLFSMLQQILQFVFYSKQLLS